MKNLLQLRPKQIVHTREMGTAVITSSIHISKDFQYIGYLISKDRILSPCEIFWDADGLASLGPGADIVGLAPIDFNKAQQQD